ncbi:MAG: phosphoglucosamine mutase [Verrucomicrobia bacterium]|jgi:phosphoglucosamine mutase|nr:phosphoglucosamine mutase [Verrucomicrobiota bacterium]
MDKLFGTDGVRGVANIHPMTAEMALAIGRATAHVCKQHDKRHRIVIGKDTRLSCYMIENALTAGICSMGVDVFLVGPVPTPGTAYITQSMRADAGIVISASHNPYQDNGIKIFTRDGYKLSYRLEEEIEEIIASGRINDIRPTAEEVGRAKRIDDALGRYIVFCKRSFPEDLTLEGLKMVIDCSNGATYKVAPIIFNELGADVTAIHCSPNGLNINTNCGSQHTEDLAAKVLETGADVGLAFDGDGDRLIAVDEKGEELDGDHIMAICAKAMQAAGKLNNNKVIITPMSNFGLRIAFDEMGIQYEDADVGDRNVLELMQQRGASMGGEQSGHTIFLDHHTTGDGIISALQLLAVMQRGDRPLSELGQVFQRAPQRLINIDVASKPPLDTIPEIQEAESAACSELGNKGRTLIRYSGTQSMCRVMVEGPTEAIVDRLANTLAEIVKRTLS